MTIIDINEAIEATLKHYQRETSEAECCIMEDSSGNPYLHTKTWTGDFKIGMVDIDNGDADWVAETLGLDTDLFYAWVTGSDGEPTLASFESSDERDTWLNQR